MTAGGDHQTTPLRRLEFDAVLVDHADMVRAHGIGAGWRHAACTLTMLSAGGCLGPVRGLYPPPPDQAVRTVYVYNNYWHTGIILRFDDLPETLRDRFAPFADWEWAEYGWGDAAYYQASEVTSGLTLRAALIPTPSVMHVVQVDPDPPSFYRHYRVELVRIELSEAGFERVARFVADSFDPDDDGRPVYLGEGLYGTSGFYEGVGSYWLFHTCNNWTADALRAGGYPITPLYAGLATNFGLQVRLNGGNGGHRVVVQRYE